MRAGSLTAGTLYMTCKGDWIIDPAVATLDTGSFYLTFSGGTSGDPLFITAVADDQGGEAGAWTAGDVITQLTVTSGSWLALLDQGGSGVLASPENLHPAGAGALYVTTLVLQEGATLNLNGSSLYFKSLVGDPGQIINVSVPEPALAALILGLAAALLAKAMPRASTQMPR